jgi:hypothetical protein
VVEHLRRVLEHVTVGVDELEIDVGRVGDGHANPLFTSWPDAVTVA